MGRGQSWAPGCLEEKGVTGGEELKLLKEEQLTFKDASEAEPGCFVTGAAAVKELRPSGVAGH